MQPYVWIQVKNFILVAMIKKTAVETCEEGHMEILKEEQYQRGVADGIEHERERAIVRAITSMLELGIDKEKILTKYSKEEYEMAVKEMEKK